MARKKKSFLEGGSNVTLSNVEALSGIDPSARYRKSCGKDKGQYVKGTHYIRDPLE